MHVMELLVQKQTTNIFISAAEKTEDKNTGRHLRFDGGPNLVVCFMEGNFDSKRKENGTEWKQAVETTFAGVTQG